MDFPEHGPLVVACKLCGGPIGLEHMATAVMVRVWVDRVSQYRGEGPFHAECGKRRDRQAQADSKTPNV